MPRKKADKVKDEIYIIVWWHFQKPYASMTYQYDDAKWIAESRNGLIIKVSGKELNLEAVLDYYRRDIQGNPMPAEMRPI